MAGVALLVLHGMGKVERDFEVPLVARLSEVLAPEEWDALTVVPVQYQVELQRRQDALWERMQTQRVGARTLREYLLFHFADAATLEHSRDTPGSIYELAQRQVLAALRKAWAAVGPDGRVVVAAYSLGGEVISDYLWDARHRTPASVGIWRDPAALGLAPDEEAFCRGGAISHLVTFGCNIPVFVAGIEPLVPIPMPEGFRWINCYDKDDPLGWPLGPLSEAYEALVTDIEVNAASGLVEELLSWTPLTHTRYWTDDEVVALIAAAVRG